MNNVNSSSEQTVREEKERQETLARLDIASAVTTATNFAVDIAKLKVRGRKPSKLEVAALTCGAVVLASKAVGLCKK